MPESQILYIWFRKMVSDKHTTRYFCEVIEQFHTTMIGDSIRSLGGDSYVLDNDNRSRSALIAL